MWKKNTHMIGRSRELKKIVKTKCWRKKRRKKHKEQQLEKNKQAEEDRNDQKKQWKY